MVKKTLKTCGTLDKATWSSGGEAALMLSILGQFWCEWTIALTLGRIYGGQKFNGQSLYYFNLHISLWRRIKSPNNKQSQYKIASNTEGVNLRGNFCHLVDCLLEWITDRMTNNLIMCLKELRILCYIWLIDPQTSHLIGWLIHSL